MSSSTPFVDIETGTLDFGQIWRETYPILGLILLFGILGVIPLYLASTVTTSPEFGFPLGRGLEFGSLLGTGLALIGQLIFAVGSGIVLMYIIVRAIQLSDA